MPSLYEQALQAIESRAAAATGWGSAGVMRATWVKVEALQCPAAHLIDGDLKIDAGRDGCDWHCAGAPELRIQARGSDGITVRDAMAQRVFDELKPAFAIRGVKLHVTNIRYEKAIADADGFLAVIEFRITFICKAFDLSQAA